MTLLPFVVGAVIIVMVLVSGMGLIIWLFPASRSEAYHKKQF